MMIYMKFFKKEPVLCIAALAAIISCFFVPPDGEYIGYIDFKTLTLLYCLMAAVAGLTKAGVFTALAHSLCSRTHSARKLGIILVLLCFFSSMLITNDVALLTFVPFAVTVLGLAGEKRKVLAVVVMQTVAANLGSMLTPPGNPQNIHLFSYYNMSLGQFLSATAPVCLASLVILVIMLQGLKKGDVVVNFGEHPGLDKRLFAVSAALFALSLLVVLRVMAWYVLLPVFVIVMFIFDRKLLLKADFMLLLTFVCFFIFVGNMGRIEAVRSTLSSLVQGRELIVGALCSQVISNVPAAVLLSGFTENGRELLLGVNIGGLGTPVASLASLISLKLFSRVEGANTGRFMGAFLIVNFGLLAVLLAFAYIFMV